MAKNNKLIVQNTEISFISQANEDYICLTDMAKAASDDARAADIIKNWIRGRGTIEFLGTWETIYNPNFKVVEFDHFKKEAGLPTFTMSVSSWVEKTDAIGIFSKAGKYGGTYAHKDIAFEFGAAISPMFKLYLIKEYQRLKEAETNQYGLEWNVRRVLSKANYRIHTDAIKEHIIPQSGYAKSKEWLLYADEADMLNVALFGCTAKDWREANMGRALSGENIRDMASINELAILSNLESLNSTLIKNGVAKKDRFKILSQTAAEQKHSLDRMDILKSIKKESTLTYVNAQKQPQLSTFKQNVEKKENYNLNEGKEDNDT
ncbi:KilA-N domain-containing protein [Dysgonomonas sp. 25]|uniref:KilA-N domain-containing protein n=1 Tax=Dysgonomonas sp. 25 TaxID=2302933 RepID=UPI0013D48A1D|nr:KilA-N domain-containing protein [Dysgonomonas sp. 25]NDV69247.1 KilA-N domain-containing protein [Dysgonomonas sp. 25]